MQNDEEDNIRARAIRPLQDEIERLQRRPQKIYNLLWEADGRIIHVYPFITLEGAQKYVEIRYKKWTTLSWRHHPKRRLGYEWWITSYSRARFTILLQEVGE